MSGLNLAKIAKYTKALFVLHAIDSSRPKEVRLSEFKISIIFVWLVLLVRPSIHFYAKMSIFNVNLRFKYLTVFKSDFRLK